MLVRRWIDYIHLFWRTKEEMAKKRQIRPKIDKNHSFLLISQRLANRKWPYYQQFKAHYHGE